MVVTHASNVIGTVQPLSETGAIRREAGVRLCIDAAQSAGVIPIDMKAMNIEIVAFTGHKSLMGPMGLVYLCVGEGVAIPHTRAGGTGVRSASRRHLEEYPFRLEYGTANMPGIVGLSCGLDLITEQVGVTGVHTREMELAKERAWSPLTPTVTPLRTWSAWRRLPWSPWCPQGERGARGTGPYPPNLQARFVQPSGSIPRAFRR